MAPGGEFSLAAALFGWPHAPGHAAPSQHAPDAWVLLFKSKHATRPVLNGMFRASKAGRAWVLEHTSSAILTLNIAGPRPAAWWRRRVQVLRDDLRRRGPLPKAFTVKTDYGSTSTLIASLIGPLLAGTSITQLTLIDMSEDGPSEALQRLLWLIAPTAKQLHSLTLDSCPVPLPPPASLPHLRYLDITLQEDDIYAEWGEGTDAYEACCSAAAYLPQLTSLTYKSTLEGDEDLTWEVLFGDTGTAAPSLTQFSTDSELTDALLTGLLKHAPSLQELSVASVALGEDYSERYSWGLQRLSLREPPQGCVDSMARLPVCRSGTLRVDTTEMYFVATSAQGLNPHVSKRLPEWHIHAESGVYVCGADTLSPVDHPSALRSTLAQLCDAWPQQQQGSEPQLGTGQQQQQKGQLGGQTVQAVISTGKSGGNVAQPGAGEQQQGPETQPGAVLQQQQHTTQTELQFTDWQWSPELLQVTLAAIPTLAQHGLSVHNLSLTTPLTDAHVAAFVDSAVTIEHVTVHSLALQSDQHADAAWPWVELLVQECSIGQLLRLPKPGGQRGEQRVSYGSLVIDDTTCEANIQQLQARLKQVQWDANYTPKVTFQCPVTHTDSPAHAVGDALRAQVSAAQALKLSVKHKDITVQLCGWPMTDATLQALPSLASLPKAPLYFTGCTWPLAPTEYTRLAQCIPRKYSEWLLGGISEEVLQSVCEGINARGKGVVSLIAPGRHGPYQQVGKHVRVRARLVY